MSAAAGSGAGGAGRFTAGFVGYVLLVTLGGALLAWPLWLLLGVFGVGADSFHKLALRSVQLVAVVGLWPLARVLDLSTREDYALRRGAGFARELANGVVLGAAGLLALAAALLLLEVRVLRETLELAPLRVAAFIGIALVGALLLAAVEEVWFRGGLYGSARRYLGVVRGAVVISTVFALVHYARSDMPVAAAEVRWWSGLHVMRHAFDRLLTQQGVFDSLLALLLFGLMLVALRERSGRLALPIGVHAGSVAVVRLLREYTVVNTDGATAWLVGGYDGVMGWLAALWMCVLITIIVRSRRLPGMVSGPPP